MKNFSLKALSITLIAAMGVSLFAGCGGGGGASGGEASAQGSTAAAPADGGSGEKVDLNLWHIQTTDPMPGIIQGSVDRFMADNPNYNVKVDIVMNDAYKQKLTVAMSSDSTPDIYSHWTGGPMIEYIKSGHCMDLTEYMNKDGYKDKFLDAAIAQATYEDKIYAVPVENVALACVFYNKDIFEQYGLSEPKTIAELEQICETLKQNGIIPFSLANKTQWTGSMYYMYFATRKGGLEPFDKAVSGEGSFEDETFVWAGQQVQKWVDAGYFNEGFNGADEDSGQSRELLYSGQAAMTIMGSWFTATVQGENPDFYQKVGLFNFPGLDGGADPNLVVGTVGDNFYSVSDKCPDVEGAFKCITYLLDDKAVEERTAASKFPPLKAFASDDPIMGKLVDIVHNAPGVQLWYDQYLPPEVSDVHKSTSQEIFGKTMTPEQANQKMQEAMEAYRAKG